jgi:hypothetical protein
MSLRKSFLYTFAIALGLLCATGVLAWTGPSLGFPGGNATAPLNVSSSGQIKTGVLTAGGLSAPTICIGVDCRAAWPSGGTSQWTTTGSTIYYNGGNVGIGTAAPLSTYDKLSVNGGNIEVYNPSSAYNPNSVGMIMGWYGGYGYVQAPNGSSVNIWNSATINIVSFNNDRTSTFYGAINANGGISDTAGARMDAGGGWIRTYGSSGWFNGTYAGGWYMQDPTWIRSYNSKYVFMDVGFDTTGASGVSCNGGLGGGYNFRVCGTEDVTSSVTAAAFYYSSDQRLKKNIAAIASSTALQDILALQPVTFNWIDSSQPTTTQLGFIAQQVEKVVPELVITDASTTMKAVDYARVTPLLVGAAQQQQAQIDAQNSKIDDQQKEIDELSAEVEALKAK